MGRCPKCAWFEWKLQSVPLCMIEEYRKMATEHNRLQLAQKQAYSSLRQKAAVNFPHDIMYLAIDASSGFEFVLPQQSPGDTEGPSKALKEMTTLPMKAA